MNRKQNSFDMKEHTDSFPSSEFIDVPISPASDQPLSQPIYTSSPIVTTSPLRQGFRPSLNFMSKSTRIAGLYVANCFICLIFFGAFFLFSAILELALSSSFEDSNPLLIIGPIGLVLGLIFLTMGTVGTLYAVKVARSSGNPTQVTYQSSPIRAVNAEPIISGEKQAPQIKHGFNQEASFTNISEKGYVFENEEATMQYDAAHPLPTAPKAPVQKGKMELYTVSQTNDQLPESLDPPPYMK